LENDHVADQSTSNEDNGQGAWARPVPARLGGLIAGLAFLTAGVFFAGFALLLPFGRVGLPGPGFFPFVLGIALVGLALAVLFYTWQERGDGEPLFIGHRDVLLAILALIGVAIAFDQEADSYLALGAFSAFLLLLVARAALWRVALGAVLGMVAVWLFFGVALGLRLPTGEYWQQMMEVVTTALPFRQP
jgi:putative tricarboxylic transport membrane protein